MRPLGYRPSAGTIGLALVAGFIALEVFLALRTGAVGIPGLVLVRLAETNGGVEALQNAATPDRGESVIAKRADGRPAPKSAGAEVTGSASTMTGEPRLEGLSEIPLKPWDQDEEESESAERKPKAEGSQEPEKLPWDAVEPVPFDSGTPVPSQDRSAALETRQSPPPPLAALPAERDVATWVKAKATEIKGADRARPLYHFEFWLDPPREVTRNLASVAYEFNTPVVIPQFQMSTETKTGFRVSAGGLTCADKVSVTLRYRDGRSQRVEVDGCKLAEASSAHAGDLSH